MCERKEKKARNENKWKKKTIEIKLMLRTIVWYFSNGWLFLPFTLLQVNYANMVHAWYREIYHWTYHSSSSNTIHDYHGGRGGDNHTHSSTDHRQTSLYFPCNTRHSLFIKQWEQLRLKWKEPIHNRGVSLYLEITCACSIGNKVLVIGNRNVRFPSLW